MDQFIKDISQDPLPPKRHVIYVTIHIADEIHDVGFYTTDNPDSDTSDMRELIARMVMEWARDYAGEDADLEP